MKVLLFLVCLIFLGVYSPPSPSPISFFTQEEYDNRIARLKAKLVERELDAYIISDGVSIYYYSGVTFKPWERKFFIVVFPDERTTKFVVPKLEELHVADDSMLGGDTVVYWDWPTIPGIGWEDVMKVVLADVKDIGIEETLPAGDFEKLWDLQFLDDTIRRKTNKFIVDPIAKQLQMVKSEEEIALLRKSAGYTIRMIQHIFEKVFTGAPTVYILQEARVLEKVFEGDELNGGTYNLFETNMLDGSFPHPSGLSPHAVPGFFVTHKEGPHVALSSIKTSGYTAECERTYFLGEPTDTEKEYFQHMLNARQAAFDILAPGIKVGDLDVAANGYLRAHGLEAYLKHRTGHGIGMGVHEAPWPSQGDDTILEAGMLVSIEPGIYHPDFGAFRHSDTVLITEDGYEVLTGTIPTDIVSLTFYK